jgi:LPXTG-site transpeptidase (sortase) family protein
LNIIKLPKTRSIFKKLVTALASFFLIILVAVLVTPIIPEIEYRFSKPDENSIPSYPISHTTTEGGETIERYITNGNRLQIPKIGVDTKIIEGLSEKIMTVKEGAWRDPNTAVPTIEGNMVIAGHRFQYLPPNTTTFYHLDKLIVGDTIKVYWEGKEYIYKVNQIFEVEPEGTWIKEQEDTGIKEITLYTCTPIYTSEKRLVVKATLV